MAKTEADMHRLLRTYYGGRSGNGEHWAYVPQVRSAAGHAATRTADAVVMALWPSRGLGLNGVEIKCSRADWLRELKDPAKAEEFSVLVDYWWVAAASRDIVQPGELPEKWGLLVPRGSGLSCVTQAERLHDELVPVGRSFLAALLRSACRVGAAGPAEVAEAVAVEREAQRAYYGEQIEELRAQRRRLETREAEFCRQLGVNSYQWRSGDAAEQARLAATVRLAIEGKADNARIERRLALLAKTAEAILADVSARMEGLTYGDSLEDSLL